jgi:hypothetical protein
MRCLNASQMEEGAQRARRATQTRATDEGVPAVQLRIVTEPDPPYYHTVRCLRCVVGYRESHYHCCLCRRVFRSAWAFERHQGGGVRGCLTDARLVRRGLVQRADDGVWAGKPMAEGTRKSLRRIA